MSCTSNSELHAISRHIDVLIIAVSDQAIADVIGNVASYLENVLIVHTSGSTHLNVLSQQTCSFRCILSPTNL